MELIITIVLFLLLILAVVWVPFLRQQHINKSEINFRDEANISLYHEHKAEIQRDFEQGAIDEENYQYLSAELEKSLLQDMESNKNADQEFDARRKGFSVVWPAIISVFVLAFSFALYNKTGAYTALTTAPQATAADSHAQLDESQQMIVRVQKLQDQTQAEPDNSSAWYSLGQGLVGLGDFDSALQAFDQVLRIEGEVADVYGAKAQAAYYKNEQVINEEVQGYMDAALAIDPLDPSTNILMGMHNFMQQRYQASIDYWQKVVDSGRDTVNIEAIKEVIQEAKNRLSLTGTVDDSQAADESLGPQIHVNVSLSDEVMEKLSSGDDKVVFIYATPVDGRRMPVAAVKINASDLPVSVVLNDARAMTPQAKLSDVESVHLYAIVSNSGGAGIKSGDFKAEQLNVSVSTKDEVELVINTLVP